MEKSIKYSVIFGNDHKNPLGALQSLGQAGIESYAVCWGEHTGLLESSRYLKGIKFAETAEACIDLLLEIVPDEERGVITPCCDEAAVVIDKHREQLEKKYDFEYSTKYSFDVLSDKGFQTQQAKAAGLNTPEFLVVYSIDDIPEIVLFPCIIKPLVAMKGSKADLVICENMEELKANVMVILPHNNGLIVEQYIDKEHEILIECCRLKDGRCIMPSVIKNDLNRLYPPNVGLSALHEVYPFTDYSIRNGIEVMLDNLGYVGLVSIEFAKSKRTGKYVFFEFNIRNDGYNPCMTKTGTNINYYYVCDMLDIPFEIQDSKSACVVSEIRHMQLLFHRKISVSEWMNDIKKSIGFTWSYKGDRKPMLKMVLETIGSAIKARIKRH